MFTPLMAEVDVIETQYPLRIERYELIPDSGGAGRLRGGLALERHLRFLSTDATLQLRSDRCRFRPYGLAGGGGRVQLRTLIWSDYV